MCIRDRDRDQAQRRNAWASWALANVAQFSGFQDRSYEGLVLPGRFYDPKGTGPSIRPHLEIPARTLTKPDPDFPDRLAQMGNGVLFPWWVAQEVTAAKRVLFTRPAGRVDDAVALLASQRKAIVETATALTATLKPAWSHIESLLVSADDGLSTDCLLYTSPSPRDRTRSRMPSSA